MPPREQTAGTPANPEGNAGSAESQGWQPQGWSSEQPGYVQCKAADRPIGNAGKKKGGAQANGRPWAVQAHGRP